MIKECMYLSICVIVFYYAKKEWWHEVESRSEIDDAIETGAFWKIVFVSAFWIISIPMLVIWNITKYVDKKNKPI